VSAPEPPFEEVRSALTLLDGLQHELEGELRPSAEAVVDATIEAISRRLWRALLQLEPTRGQIIERSR